MFRISLKLNRRKEILRLAIAVLLVLIALKCHARAGETLAESLVAEARTAAAEDRHRDAITNFHRAIDEAPALRSQLALELGYQYTWAEIPDSAIEWFEYHLSLDPGDAEAEVGIARALSWADRLGEAEARYRRVLANDPDNTQAKLGLAEVTNWSGRHDESQAMYERILAEDPDNGEAIRGLAYAQHWGGRTDLALETIRSAGPRDGLDTVLRDIHNVGSIDGSHAYAHRENTTDGSYGVLSSTFRHTPRPRTELGVRYDVGRMTQLAYPDVRRDALHLSLQRFLTPTFALNVIPGYEWNRIDGSAGDFNLFVWDVYGTWTPNGDVRIDVGNSRQTFNIPSTLVNGIDYTTTSAGLDWRWSRRLISYWEAMYGTYSDDNARVTLAQRIDWTPPLRVSDRPTDGFVVSQGADYFAYEKETDSGYYSPLSYVYLYAGLRFVYGFGPRFTIDVAGQAGGEKANGTDWHSVGSYELSARYRAANHVFLRAGFGQSGSRLANPAGFRSKGFFVSIDYPIR